MIEGYILLPIESASGYYGIDRGLFEPLLIESEFEQNIPTKKYTTVSSFYPPGWRKTAYELYELHQTQVDDTFSILKDFNTASKIRDLIFPYLGGYDIFFIQIADHVSQFSKLDSCYGYDFAYQGGDYYSAVKNGLFINGSESLNKKYRPHLNKHGLFNDPSLFENYISDFKKEVLSEVNSTFWIYRLIKE
jgi:hypothetical protein